MPFDDEYRLELPVPPSVNTIYRRGRQGQVYRSKRADAYDRTVLETCLETFGCRPRLDGPLALTVELYLMRLADLDWDNAQKVLGDALAKCFGYDDKEIVSARVEKRLVTQRRFVRCVVTLRPIPFTDGRTPTYES